MAKYPWITTLWVQRNWITPSNIENFKHLVENLFSSLINWNVPAHPSLVAVSAKCSHYSNKCSELKTTQYFFLVKIKPPQAEAWERFWSVGAPLCQWGTALKYFGGRVTVNVGKLRKAPEGNHLEKVSHPFWQFSYLALFHRNALQNAVSLS